MILCVELEQNRISRLRLDFRRAKHELTISTNGDTMFRGLRCRRLRGARPRSVRRGPDIAPDCHRRCHRHHFGLRVKRRVVTSFDGGRRRRNRRGSRDCSASCGFVERCDSLAAVDGEEHALLTVVPLSAVYPYRGLVVAGDVVRGESFRQGGCHWLPVIRLETVVPNHILA